MPLSTQQTLEVMGNSSDDDADYIDVELERSDRRTTKVKTGTKRYSLSQPASRKRKCKSPEPVLLDDSVPVIPDVNSLIKLITKMSKDVKEMKSLVNKEIPALKTSLAQATAELGEIKAKIETVAPPINLENNLSRLTEKVDQVSLKVNQVSVSQNSKDIENKLEEIVDVEQKLKQRKMKFYDYHSYSERHAIYSSREQLEHPFIMSKYLPGLIENEPAEEYEARRRKTENNRLCDMELLSLRAQRAKSALDNIDAEIAQAISDFNGEEEVKVSLSERWRKMVEAEEEKSKKLWEKTAKNLLDTPKRETDTNRIVVEDGRTYASVLKKSKSNSKKKDESVEEMQIDNTDTGESSEWTKATAKNSRSHSNKPPVKKTQDPQPQNVQFQPPASFRKRGPKFKPWYQRQNRWNYQNYNNQQWW